MATSAATAADAPASSPQFNIMGPSRCAGWPKTGAITSAEKAVSLNWALGFLSGWAAYANLALLDVVEPKVVDDWLTTYCKANPTVPLPLAVRELERDFESRLPPPEPSPEAAVPPPPPASGVQDAAPTTKAVPSRRAAVHRKAPPKKPAATTPAPKTPPKPQP
ncbi:MAG TPA: hypothetical protein VL358_02085 [Caulobacteraceae bacterium]|nr:hypothetical protein [Caulobacteraceae bacterium]